MEVVLSGIIEVVKEIVKAARMARKNRERCLDLADRARIIGDILRLGSSTVSTANSAGGYTYTEKMREPSLKSLEAALAKARELVKSQQQGGFGDRDKKVATSAETDTAFQRVEERITACVVDVGLAEQFAARYRALHANKGTGSTPMASLAPEHHHQSPSMASLASQHHHQSASMASLAPEHHHQSASMASLAPEHHHQSLQFMVPSSSQQGGFGDREVVTSAATDTAFQRVEERITTCVTDVGLAEQFAARYRALHATPAVSHHYQSSQFASPSLHRHHQSSQFVATTTAEQHQSFQSTPLVLHHFQSSQIASPLSHRHQSSQFASPSSQNHHQSS